MTTKHHLSKILIIALSILTVIVVLSTLALIFVPKIAFNAQSVVNKEFPDYNANSQISESRKTLLGIVKTEWETAVVNESSFNILDPYANGVKYAEENREPWCADFVSWVYQEAGRPFQNPNNGGWRIPGIYTLKEYLDEKGAWRDAGNYIPTPGDIIVYNGGLFGGHTNLVIDVDGDNVTTVGGNENGVIMMRTYNYTDSQYGIWGFGDFDAL